MVELQLQIVREACNQSLGINVIAVKTQDGKIVVVEAVAQNSCSALGGLKVGDVLLSANGYKLDPTPTLDAVISTMSKLPASFSVVVERKSTAENMATVAGAATSSTKSSSSSGSGSSSSPQQEKKHPGLSENVAAAAMEASDAPSKESQRPSEETMAEEAQPLPKSSPPGSRLTGGNLHEMEAAHRSSRTNMGASGSNDGVSSDDSSGGSSDGGVSDASYKKTVKKPRNGSVPSPSKVGRLRPSRLSDARKAKKVTASSEVAPAINDSDENLVDLSLLDGDDDEVLQPDVQVHAAPSLEGDDCIFNDDGMSGGNDDDRSSSKALVPLTWAPIGAANANDTEVLLYALLVLLELNGCPQKVDAVISAVDHCMEAHRRKVRRAQRHKSKRHGGSNSSSSSSSNSEKDDEQEDEDELNVLGTRAFSRLPGAWWSLGRNSSSTSSDLLANAPLSPKVTSVLDRALLPAKSSSSALSQPSTRTPAQESARRARVVQLSAAAYAIQVFPGRGGCLLDAISLPSRSQQEAAPAEDVGVSDSSSRANNEDTAATAATTAAPDVDAATTATAEHRFGWRDLNEYLKWYAAERYLTGGTASRKGPPWAREMPQMSSNSKGSHGESCIRSRGSGNGRSGASENHQRTLSDRGQPLRLRAYACAGRIATLLWEHGDSLWRLLCRGDRFQVLPLWEHYDAVAYDTCASIAPILKVPAEHLIAVNAWRFSGLKSTSRFRPGNRIDYQPSRDTLNLRFLSSYVCTLAQQVAAGIPQANTFFGLNEKGNGNEHGRRSSVKASSLKYGSDESARVQGGGGGRGANVTADNSASVYNGRGWIGRQDGLSQDDVAARRHKASRSVIRAADLTAAEDMENGILTAGAPSRDEFLAARRGGRKWRAWELEALQSAVRAFRSRRRNLDQMAALMGHIDEDIPIGLAAIGTEQQPSLALGCDGSADVNTTIEDLDGAEGTEATSSSSTSLGNDLVLAVGRTQPRARFIPGGPLAALASPLRALSPRSDDASSTTGLSDSTVRSSVTFVCSAGMPSRTGPVCFCSRGGNKPVVRVNSSGQVLEKYCSCAKAAAQHGFTLKQLAVYFQGLTDTCEGHQFRFMTHADKDAICVEQSTPNRNQDGDVTSMGTSTSTSVKDSNEFVPSVVLVDTDGNVLKQYATQKDAAVDLKMSTTLVSMCVRGVIPSAKGHRLMPFAKDKNIHMEETEGVVLLDDQGNVLSQYDSHKLAANALGISQAMVANSVRRLFSKAAGTYRLRAIAPDGVYPTLKDEHLMETECDAGEIYPEQETKYSRKRKAMVLLDDLGNVISHYDSQGIAADALRIPKSTVSSCVRGMFPKAEGKYRLRLAAADGQYPTLESEGWPEKRNGRDADEVNNPRKRKAVVLLDDHGEVLSHYDTQGLAADALGISASAVSNCVRGQFPKVAGKYRLRSVAHDGKYSTLESEGWTANEIEDSGDSVGVGKLSCRYRKAVVLLDDQGNVLAQYESQTLAAEALGIASGIVSTCVRGLIPKAARKYRLRSVTPDGIYSSLKDEGWPENETASIEETGDPRTSYSESNRLTAAAASMPLSKSVVLLDNDGSVLQEFASQSMAAKVLGVNQGQVSQAVRGLIPRTQGHRLCLARPDGIYPAAPKEHDGVLDVYDNAATDSSEINQLDGNDGGSQANGVIARVSPVASNQGGYRRCKEVVLLDENGQITREFPSSAAASVALGLPQPSISLCINGKIPSVRGYVLRLKNPHEIPITSTVNQTLSAKTLSIDDVVENTKAILDDGKVTAPRSSSPVNCATGEDILIREVASATNSGITDSSEQRKPEADTTSVHEGETYSDSRHDLKQSISAAASSDFPLNALPVSSTSRGRHSRKEVELLDENGHVNHEYPSVSAAAVALGVPAPYISNCVNGKTPTARGFVLRFKHPPTSTQSATAEALEHSTLTSSTASISVETDQSPNASGVSSSTSTSSRRRKEVVLLDKEGQITSEFSGVSAASAALHLNATQVSLCVNGKIPDVHGFVLRFKNPPTTSDPNVAAWNSDEKFSKNSDENVNGSGVSSIVTASSKNRSRKEVVLLDEHGKITREFPSSSAASAALGVNTSYVSLCVNGKIPDARGFILRFKHPQANLVRTFAETSELNVSTRNSESLCENSADHSNGGLTSISTSSARKSNGKEVVLLDEYGKVTREFPSSSAASAALGVNASYISLCVNGKIPDAHGYVLRFKNPPVKSEHVPNKTQEFTLKTRNQGSSSKSQEIVVDDGDSSVPLSPIPNHPSESGQSIEMCEAIDAAQSEGMHLRKTRLSNRLGFSNSGAASKTAVSTMASSQASDRRRAGVLPGIANPNQGPRHRLLIGATIPNIGRSPIEDPSTSAAATTVMALLPASSDRSLAAASNTSSALDHAQDDTSTTTGVSSNSLQLSRDEGDGGGATNRPKWQVVASSHAPSHARARELWRCMQRNELSMPESRALAPPVDHLTETRPAHAMGEEQTSQSTRQLVLPGTVYQPQPLVSSAVNYNASGTCKAWRLTPVTVWPSSQYSNTDPIFQLAPGATFDYDAKRSEEILVAGRRRPVTFYRLSLGASGIGAPWATSATNEAWVHDLPPLGGSVSSLSSSSSLSPTKDPLSAYLADKPALFTLSEDVKVAEIDDAEWEELAEAAGLSLSFTGDECQDAWEQLWHDDTAPGYELLRHNYQPIWYQVYTTQELKYSMKWGQAARKRSRLRGKRIDEDGDDDEERDSVLGSSSRDLGNREQYVTSWKPYKCPVPGCLKRYVIKRACANHPDRNCIKDVSSQASSSSLTSKRNFAAPADAEESEPEEVIQALSPMDFCDVCGSNADEEKLLICENCVTGWSSSDEDEKEVGRPGNQHTKLQCFGSAHTFCLGLRRIPKGDWYCSECTSATEFQGEMVRNKRRAKARVAIESQLHSFAAHLQVASRLEFDDFSDGDNDTEHDVEEDSDSTEYGDDEVDSSSLGRVSHVSSPASQGPRDVVVCDDDGKVLFEFSSQKECAAFLGVSQTSVCTTVAGKTKRANGHRIFQRRADNVYPSIDEVNDGTFSSSLNASSKQNDPMNGGEVKRKRGRPTLNVPSVKRKRGRPSLDPTEVKRKRGRPPSFKNLSPSLQKVKSAVVPSNDTSKFDEVDFCDVCGSNADEEKLLVCENYVAGELPCENDDKVADAEDDRSEGAHKQLQCFGSAHTFCLGLRKIPNGDWYCSKCTSAQAFQGGMTKVHHRAKARAAIKSQLHTFTTSLEVAGHLETDDVGVVNEEDANDDDDDDVDHDVEEDTDSMEYGDDEINSTSRSRNRTIMSPVSSPTPQVTREVVVCDDDGKVLLEFGSQKECAAHLGISQPTASACLTGRTKRASGHRLFQRRPDNVYPSAEAASDTPASGLRAPTVIQRKVQKKTKAVVLLDGYGKVLAKYGTQSEASTALGLSPVVVSNAVRSGRVAKEFGSEEECLAYLGIAQPTASAGTAAGRTKLSEGYQIFLRRPDNVNPPAVASSYTQASKLCAGKAVVLLDSTGKVLQKFASQSEAGAALGLSPAQVSNAVRGSRVAKLGSNLLRAQLAPGSVYSTAAAAKERAGMSTSSSVQVDAVAATDRTADARATDDSPHIDASSSDTTGNSTEIVQDIDEEETDTEAENEEFDGEPLESDATNDGEDGYHHDVEPDEETEEDLREDERFDSDATEDDDKEN